jgi:putative nucleotidyltransferase with HDIG domain
MAIISFFQVKRELQRQGQRRLHEAARTLGTSIYDRMINVDKSLEILSLGLHLNPADTNSKVEGKYIELLQKTFKALVFVNDSGKALPIFGKVSDPRNQTPEWRKQLLSGKALVLVSSSEENSFHIYMLKQIDPKNPGQGVLWGEINSMYLWGLDENKTLPAMTELTVLDSLNNVIFTTISVPSEFSQRPEFKGVRSSLSHFEWEQEGKCYQAACWTLFMNYQWGYPRLTIVVSTPNHHIFAPIAFFRKIFPLVILLSLWVVLLLSAVQIRRNTQPLQKLMEATKRIANKDFDSRVSIVSGDEFEKLGASFNNMSRQLGRQFKALSTIGMIERSILSFLDSEKIVDTVIACMKDIFSNDVVGVALFNSQNEKTVRIYMKRNNPGKKRFFKNISLFPEDIQRLNDQREVISIDEEKDFPDYLAPIAGDSVKSFVIFPLFIRQALGGFIALGLQDPNQYDPEDLLQARQIANQVAVALANAQLIEDLDLLNWGTLTALARTVDAKSSWTAGHSERVTKMAIRIGQAMGLSPDELQNLHRGALLHDIGKIATPVSVLDKLGKLTDEERQIVEAHSSTGARILEPIKAYASIIPMVEQHHEHFDGTGYPKGLTGEEISLGGRILAVADVYDALVSDRPYREGMDKDRVIAIIREAAGKHFDPNIVKVFLSIINDETEIGMDYEKMENRISFA